MMNKNDYAHHEIGDRVWVSANQYSLNSTYCKQLKLTNYIVNPAYLPTYGITTLVVVSRYWDDYGWYHGVEDPKGLQYVIYGAGVCVK